MSTTIKIKNLHKYQKDIVKRINKFFDAIHDKNKKIIINPCLGGKSIVQHEPKLREGCDKPVIRGVPLTHKTISLCIYMQQAGRFSHRMNTEIKAEIKDLDWTIEKK